jgi:hypothetical protein
MMPKRRGEKEKSCFTFRFRKNENRTKCDFDKAKTKKNLSGGFAWFEVPKTEYITRHILAGLTPFETK